MFRDRIYIVMITPNRAAQTGESLRRLIELPEEQRILVVNGGSSDETVHVARGFGAAERVIPPYRNRSGARDVTPSGRSGIGVPFARRSPQPGSLALGRSG